MSNKFYNLVDELSHINEAKLTPDELFKPNNASGTRGDTLFNAIQNKIPLTTNNGEMVVIIPDQELITIMVNQDYNRFTSNKNKYIFKTENGNKKLSDFTKTSMFGSNKGNNKNAMGAENTRTNEIITMYYTEQLVENNKTPNKEDVINRFNAYDDSWENTYIQTAISVKSWLKSERGYIYSRDKGFMDFITHAVTALNFKNKDVWNPADIWLVKEQKYQEIKTKITDIVHGSLAPINIKIEELNAVMKQWIVEKVVVGISLKKLTGKTAKVEETNFIKSDKKVEIYKITSMVVDFTLNKNGDDFAVPVRELSYKINNNINVQMRAFPDKPSNIQLEVIGKGQKARFGKIPLRDTVDVIFGSYGNTKIKRLLYKKDIAPLIKSVNKRDIKQWCDIYHTVITSKLHVSFKQSRSEFEDILTNALYLARVNKNIHTHLSNKLQALYIMYSYVLLNNMNELDTVTGQFIHGAKKQTKWAGPFIKVY